MTQIFKDSDLGALLRSWTPPPQQQQAMNRLLTRSYTVAAGSAAQNPATAKAHWALWLAGAGAMAAAIMLVLTLSLRPGMGTLPTNDPVLQQQALNVFFASSAEAADTDEEEL